MELVTKGKFKTGRVYDFDQLVEWEIINSVSDDDPILTINDHIVVIRDDSRGMKCKVKVCTFDDDQIRDDDILKAYDDASSHI